MRRIHLLEVIKLAKEVISSAEHITLKLEDVFSNPDTYSFDTRWEAYLLWLDVKTPYVEGETYSGWDDILEDGTQQYFLEKGLSVGEVVWPAYSVDDNFLPKETQNEMKEALMRDSVDAFII
jgi:hypothetical protein